VGLRIPGWLRALASAPQEPAQSRPSSSQSQASGSEPLTANPASAADSTRLEVELRESHAAQVGLKRDLGELLKSHRQQTRQLERVQKLNQQLETDLARERERISSLEVELGSLRKLPGEHAAQVAQLEARLEELAGLRQIKEELAQERERAAASLGEITRSRDNVQAERDRLAGQLAGLHATLAARDAEIAALKIADEELKERLLAAEAEVQSLKAGEAALKGELERLTEVEAARTRLEIEHQTLTARWEVARAQHAETEQALKTAQATIKAAQRLSSSVEWRSALDGVLDAASELVRFERGTLALVDEVQEELKVEAARNSPIAISEMSRFKVGEGIAGWALSHREPVLVRDSRTDPRFKASDPSHRPRSVIAVPLAAGNEALGVLTVTRPATDPFAEQDLRSLARVASDAATALTNARVVHLLKQREDDLSLLVQRAKELWTAASVSEAVDFICRTARDFAGGTAALLAFQDAKTRDLEVAGSVGLPQPILAQRIAWGAPAANDVVRSGKPWLSAMRDMLPASLLDTVEAAGLRALISVPCGSSSLSEASEENVLLSRSDPGNEGLLRGVLNVYRSSAEPLPASQLEQLQAFGEQALAALGNLRRWERIKGQLQTTASLNTRLLGRERYINQLHFRIQQLEQELGKYKAA
jgi:putative methionine-R-sulfoxide reductase with GAF domain